ncbi:YhcB family protein [Larsenimonas rhizosphaerae]|uniref:Z-ring associated protein G n=1 Tax=Larsenimonas rhizosphaerae TaxID=2944682 RepID=A0AA41ZL40_9GAMM|nr:DUF1043 family protein [Larsenimonas rhizosphaerae]MCX2523768.1 DUF1043 family protein [Larsenimonas rhizosphaerae]
MNEGNIDWILGLACLLVGMGIGALGYHLMNANARRNRQAQQKLKDTERELNQVRETLNGHFSQTADLVAQLQRTGQELQQQFAADAERLCSDEQVKRRLRPQDETAEREEESSLHIPRDYAESARGTLSENYGIRRGPAEEDPQPPRY